METTSKMKTTTLIEITPDGLKSLVKQALNEHDKEKLNSQTSTKIYSFNQVKNILGCSHTTVKKLVKEGVLKTTADQRRIPAWAINEYLNSKK